MHLRSASSTVMLPYDDDRGAGDAHSDTRAFNVINDDNYDGHHLTRRLKREHTNFRFTRNDVKTRIKRC